MSHQPGLHHELVLIDQPQLRHLSSGCIFDGRADGGEFFCFCQSSLQPGGAPFLAEFVSMLRNIKMLLFEARVIEWSLTSPDGYQAS
jgi:hypothetical protein